MSKTHDTDDLEEEYDVYASLAELSRMARERAINAPHDNYVAKIHIKFNRKNEERKTAIGKHFDRVDRALFDMFLVRLVATFERCAFEKLKTALGEARATVQKHYEPSHPFARAAQHLVKDAGNFYNLSDLDTLLASYPQAPCKDFQALREHRNYVTHGGRVGAQSRFARIQEVYMTLSELLQIISRDVPETS